VKALVVANFRERDNGLMFYDTARKLTNGLTRAGCNVYAFSDREIARNDAPLFIRPLGLRSVNRRLIETVENFEPDLILLCHADTVYRETLETIRSMAKRPRIALRNVDPLFIPKNVENIRTYADLVDAIFVTTAGEPLRQFSRPGNVVSFMPNPVDGSIESYRAYENPEPANDLFFATRYTRFTNRVDFCEELRKRLPEIRFDFRGFDGKPPVYGSEYGKALFQCRMGLNLDKASGWYLYSSARMAQYMGNGLLTLMERACRFDRFFTEDEAAFYDDLDGLEKQIRRFKQDDALARATAERGCAKYHALFDSTRIAQYIIEVTLGLPLSQDYPWPTERY
jgi:Glycosyl transferases group 1